MLGRDEDVDGRCFSPRWWFLVRRLHQMLPVRMNELWMSELSILVECFTHRELLYILVGWRDRLPTRASRRYLVPSPRMNVLDVDVERTVRKDFAY